MKSVPLSSQNTAEFTTFLPFSQHNRLGAASCSFWQQPMQNG
jgi:hypothetical protein